MKTLLGNLSTKVGKVSYIHHVEGTAFTMKQMIMENFALGRELGVTGTWDIHNVAWRSTDNKTFNQVDYTLFDGRHCTNVCDVRNMRGAEIESGHFF